MELGLKNRYLTDENEREDGARYYIETFGNGRTRALDIVVGPTRKLGDVARMEAYLRCRLDVDSIVRVEKMGLFSNKVQLRAELHPQRIDYAHMLAISNAQYAPYPGLRHEHRRAAARVAGAPPEASRRLAQYFFGVLLATALYRDAPLTTLPRERAPWIIQAHTLTFAVNPGAEG